MRLFIPGIWFLLATVCSYADIYVRQPEVDIVHYDIALELTDTSDSIAGTTRIHVRMRKDGVSGMRLDFAGMQVDSLQVQGISEVSRCATAACRLISGENMRAEKSQLLPCATTASLSRD